MALVYDNTKPASQGGGWVEWNGPIDNSPEGWLTELARRRERAAQDLAQHQRNWKRVRNVAYGGAAVPFAAAAAPFLAGGGAGAAGGGATLPAAATEGMLPMSVATGAGAGGMFAGMSPRDWLSLALSGVGTVGGAMQNRPNLNPNTTTQDPNLQRLLETMQGRLDKSEPLYDSIMAMANGLLPTRYQKGGGGMP